MENEIERLLRELGLAVAALPQSREKSLVITKLDEAELWYERLQKNADGNIQTAAPAAPVKTAGEDEKLLNIKQTASRLGVSDQTVERLIREQKLGSHKVAGRVMVSEERHLKPFLKRCERPAQN